MEKMQIKEKVKEIMAKVFNVELSSIGDDASPDTIENWDSLRHMNFIISLEEGFGVEIGDEQITQMLNLELIVIVLQELLGGG